MTFLSWIAAIAGAVIAPYVFRYVLVQWWMAQYVPDALPVDLWSAVRATVLGTLALMASSALAAYGSRRRVGGAGAARAGALAGLLSAGMIFALFGVPAAGAAGARPVYPYWSATMPPPDPGRLYLAVRSCVLWTYAMGALMWLVGAGIGATVGWVVGAAPVGASPETERRPGLRLAGRLLLWLLVGVVGASLAVGAVAFFSGGGRVVGAVVPLAMTRRAMLGSGSAVLLLLIFYLIASYRAAPDRPLSLPGVPTLVAHGLGGGTLLAALAQSLAMGPGYNLAQLILPVLPYATGQEAPPEVAASVLEMSAYQAVWGNYQIQALWGIRALLLAWAVGVLVMLALGGVAWLWRRSVESEA
jgi:hypothetical protein